MTKKPKKLEIPAEKLLNAPATHFRQWYFIDLSGVDIQPDEVFQPEVWKYASHLARNDVLEIVSADWDCELICRVAASGVGYTVLKELLRTGSQPESAGEDFIPGEARIGLSPGLGWRLFGADGREIGRYATKVDAEIALRNHLTNAAAAALAAA